MKDYVGLAEARLTATAGKTSPVLAADWFDQLTPLAKKIYIKHHPNSKYAQQHGKKK